MKTELEKKYEELVVNFKEVGTYYFNCKNKASKQDVLNMSELVIKGEKLESEIAILKKQQERGPDKENVIPVELDQLLFDCTQLFDSWHSDVAWSEWDESVRQRVSEFRKIYTYKTEGVKCKKCGSVEELTNKEIRTKALEIVQYNRLSLQTFTQEMAVNFILIFAKWYREQINK